MTAKSSLRSRWFSRLVLLFATPRVFSSSPLSLSHIPLPCLLHSSPRFWWGRHKAFFFFFFLRSFWTRASSARSARRTAWSPTPLPTLGSLLPAFATMSSARQRPTPIFLFAAPVSGWLVWFGSTLLGSGQLWGTVASTFVCWGPPGQSRRGWRRCVGTSTLVTAVSLPVSLLLLTVLRRSLVARLPSPAYPAGSLWSGGFAGGHVELYGAAVAAWRCRSHCANRNRKRIQRNRGGLEI